jgi:hypothetical protein
VGAVALVAFTSVVIAYVAVGTLARFVRSGVVEMPHAGFWLAVWDSAYAAAVFLVTCGLPKPSPQVYDRIE